MSVNFVNIIFIESFKFQFIHEIGSSTAHVTVSIRAKTTCRLFINQSQFTLSNVSSVEPAYKIRCKKIYFGFSLRLTTIYKNMKIIFVRIFFLLNYFFVTHRYLPLERQQLMWRQKKRLMRVVSY